MVLKERELVLSRIYTHVLAQIKKHESNFDELIEDSVKLHLLHALFNLCHVVVLKP